MTTDAATTTKELAKNAVCTIVSKNYFAYARTLVASYSAQHPSDDCYVLVVDEATDREKFVCADATVFFLEDLKLPDWRKIAFKFDIMELNTNVKPSFLKFLLARGHGIVVYLDPDIYVYKPIAPVHEALSHSNIVVTPHTMTPMPEDGCRPLDRDLLKAGVYNLGFIGVTDAPEALRFLSWWEERCLKQGFNEPSMGWFVDQHWIDLVPSYFDKVQIIKHVGCNVAYWNLHERQIYESGRDKELTVNSAQPLIFFHYSGIDPTNAEAFSKHQSRFNLVSRPDIRRIVENYASRLLDNGFLQFKQERYGFGYFSSGEAIPSFLRRYYAEHSELSIQQNPFSETSAVRSFAQTHRMLQKPKSTGNSRTVNSLTKISNKDARKLRVAGLILRSALRLLGPNRFEMLCRFMRYYGVPNNQASIMFALTRRSL